VADPGTQLQLWNSELLELRDPIGTRAGGGGISNLLVDGIPYDVYTPTSANPNRIISAIAKKNDQTTGIVLDLSNSPVTSEQLGNILGRVNGAGATKLRVVPGSASKYSFVADPGIRPEFQGQYELAIPLGIRSIS